MGAVVPLRPDAREAVAVELDAQHMVCAAALVRTGLPAAALVDPLTVELATRFGLGGTFRKAMTALVIAWGLGRDAAVVRALAAWERGGCDLCALAALDTGASACARCAEVG